MTDVYRRRPPGSRLPSPVQTALWMRDPVGHIERCRRRYGPVFTVRFVGVEPYVFVADPSLAREVYAADRTVGRAGEARADFLEQLVGEHSLLVSEGERWLRHRRMLGPAFHRSHVDGYAEEIAAIAAEAIERWPHDEPFALRPRMQEMTLEVILRLVFGVTDEARLGRFRELLPRLVEGAGGQVMLWLLPAALWKRPRTRRALTLFPNPLRSFLDTRAQVDRLVYDEIAHRRATPDESRHDVLSLLLRARDDEGRAMIDVEVRDELITLLEAGHETTATALAWAFERLLRHPAELERLTREVHDGGDAYLDATVRETLRTRPVVPDTPRRLAGPLQLGGYEIPRGWHATVGITSVQLDPAGTADPERFRPERFLDSPPRDGWIPFGGGKRHCVGSHLALLEMKVVIAEVLRRLRLEAPRPEPERARAHHVTLVPAEGGLVTALPLAPRPAARQTGGDAEGSATGGGNGLRGDARAGRRECSAG